ncbi:hypothetical protein PG994_000494 [Apiospora phragmitis]|uniref:G-patch domain-containing protein n=1 Tax=Apiospora phragmitis TaxID=2905665 RepID=A0ABR1X6J7_9PEZI
MASKDAADVRYDDDDDDYDVRLEHKKPFSAGLRRKLIQFVPASSEETTSTEQNRTTSTPAKSIEDIYLNIVMPPRDTASAPPESPVSYRISVLKSQGWDPDARKGLGASQQGVQYPIKAKQKRDMLGIGVQVPKDLEKWKKEKPQKLDAGKVRKKAAEDKKRRERLQRQFYGNPDIEKYLG